MHGLNDIGVLRKILGDKDFDDKVEDNFLKRKIPKMNMQEKRNLVRDFVSKNNEAGFETYNDNPEDYVDLGSKPKVDTQQKVKMNEKNPSPVTYSKSNEEKEMEALINQKKRLKAETEILQFQEQKNKLLGRTTMNNPNEREISFNAKIPQLPQYDLGSNPLQYLMGKKSGGSINKGGLRDVTVKTTIPTVRGVRSGLQDFATPLTNNLASISGGGFIGGFSNPNATQRLSQATLGYQSYTNNLIAAYRKKGYNINSESQLMGVATPTQRKRLIELRNQISAAQTTATQTGFLSGSGGNRAIQSSINRPNFNKLTNIGNTNQDFGSFGPEALSRLGVNQNLSSIKSENKWENLLGFKGGTGAGKVASILGKGPDPTGAKEKLKRYL